MNNKYIIENNNVVDIKGFTQIKPEDFKHMCFRCGEELNNGEKIGDKGVKFICPKCKLSHLTYHY